MAFAAGFCGVFAADEAMSMFPPSLSELYARSVSIGKAAPVMVKSCALAPD